MAKRSALAVQDQGHADRMRAKKQFESGIPACWTWELPDRDLIEAVESDPLGDLLNRIMLMDLWHDDRCAVCGRWTLTLVRDHDHATGLIRGYLCGSCNHYESHGERLIFDRYRLIYPTLIFDLEWRYA